MTRLLIFSSAVETTIPPQTSGPAARGLSPLGPTLPASSWLHNQCVSMSMTSPVRFRSICGSQVDGAHADPIPHSRDAQRPEFAVGLRYKHASDRLRSVRLLPERKRQFSQPPLDPLRFDVRKVLAVHARCTLVRAALGIGVRQNIFAADLVVQGVEAIIGFRLRFCVQRHPQLLNTFRSY